MAETYDEMMRRRFREGLRRSGGLYEPEDIIQACKDGDMQMFTEGDSFIVTCIEPYPRKRVLNVVILVGHLEHLDALYLRVVQFAQDVAADYIRAVGRPGWERIQPARWGFHPVQTVWLKEIE